MRSDVAPGGLFPDYQLPDHENVPRRLSELQGDDPLILTLARGHYCPKEHRQHLDLASLHPKIAVAYTRIVTISTDVHHTGLEFRASVGAVWPFLSDPERIVQKDLDTPGLRDDWQAGDLASFHGWNRRAAPAPTQPDRADHADHEERHDAERL